MELLRVIITTVKEFKNVIKIKYIEKKLNIIK